MARLLFPRPVIFKDHICMDFTTEKQFKNNNNGGGGNRKFKKSCHICYAQLLGKMFIPDVLLLQMSFEDRVSRTAVKSLIFNLLYQRPGNWERKIPIS